MSQPTAPRRHDDALFIQQGACNPSGIARSIAEACREVWDEGGTPTRDPAVRLMVHQLAFICGVREIDEIPQVYSMLTSQCAAGADAARAARKSAA